jgi:hypothetical protein
MVERSETEHGLATTASSAHARGASASPIGSKGKIVESADDPEFRLAAEVLYHGARMAFLSGAHRWMMFAAIVFGAGAATAIAPVICGLLAMATAAADIAFDFTGRSQHHADIRRRYLDIVARLARAGASVDFTAEWMAISADEPPLFRTVAMIAHENACLALHRPLPEARVGRWRRIGAHIWRG